MHKAALQSMHKHESGENHFKAPHYSRAYSGTARKLNALSASQVLLIQNSNKRAVERDT